MNKLLTTSIQYLKGIGPKRAKSFNKLGINIIGDLLYYFPLRYEDRRNFSTISQLKEGQTQTIKAVVLASGGRNSFRRSGFSITEIIVGDATGKIPCVWFNQPYLKNYFQVGSSLILYGKVEQYAGSLQMNSAEFEVVCEGQDEPLLSLESAKAAKEGRSGSLNIGRIIPIYSLPEGITQRNFRSSIKYALDEFLPEIGDFLPYDVRSRNNLLNMAKSLINIHFPEDFGLQKEAHRRLSFEEFFLFQIPLALRKSKNKAMRGITHKVEGKLAKVFIASLPFQLTKAQEGAVREIRADMASPKVMQRLLQGDVGSGKTIVATIAAMFAVQGGYQTAFMAPTEILARQHYEKIKCQVSSVKCQEKAVRIGLVTGSASDKEKKRAYQEIREGAIDLIIGTHALLEKSVNFKNLGLVVIDEQHKFGVGQRALLPAKGISPDVLIMTATPIPRTLAITLYGDLDVSIIDELPSGRLPVKTMHFSEEDRSVAYSLARDELRKNHQAYVIYPVIEESYALDIAGAKKTYEELKIGEFEGFKLGLIHGRLKQREQDEVMAGFKNGDLDALVATTVLEVGIDMPNATCMIIEHAYRFGLSQLHQLRGRIGRGSLESFCVLISDTQTEEAKARMAAMVKYSDGFRISEEDLRIRGPGEFFGSRQHGLAELKIANLLTQMQLLKRAREEAIRLINTDPRLEKKQDYLLKQELLQRFPEYEKLIMVG